MKPLGRNEIAGTWGTLLLPISADESINWEILGDEIDVLIASGVQGVYSNGTAGEFYAQTDGEFDRIQEMLAARCNRAGVPFQIGASHSSAQVMLERVKRAGKLQPSAIQVILPDWYPLSPEETRSFVAKVAEAAAPVGIVVYNPPHAKRVLSPEEWVALADAVAGLVGVKVAGGDDAWYREMAKTGLSVFVAGHDLASGVARGAAGSYSNVACLSPRGAAGWNALMYTDTAAALEMEARIKGFITQYVLPFRDRLGVSNAALDKLLAAVGGWSEVGLRLRWPYRWIEEPAALALRPVAREMVPELFDAR